MWKRRCFAWEYKENQLPTTRPTSGTVSSPRSAPIRTSYVLWYASGPFDIGHTTYYELNCQRILRS